MRHEYVSPYVQSANAAARKRALAAREFLKKERKKAIEEEVALEKRLEQRRNRNNSSFQSSIVVSDPNISTFGKEEKSRLPPKRKVVTSTKPSNFSHHNDSMLDRSLIENLDSISIHNEKPISIARSSNQMESLDDYAAINRNIVLNTSHDPNTSINFDDFYDFDKKERQLRNEKDAYKQPDEMSTSISTTGGGIRTAQSSPVKKRLFSPEGVRKNSSNYSASGHVIGSAANINSHNKQDAHTDSVGTSVSDRDRLSTHRVTARHHVAGSPTLSATTSTPNPSNGVRNVTRSTSPFEEHIVSMLGGSHIPQNSNGAPHQQHMDGENMVAFVSALADIIKYSKSSGRSSDKKLRRARSKSRSRSRSRSSRSLATDSLFSPLTAENLETRNNVGTLGTGTYQQDTTKSSNIAPPANSAHAENTSAQPTVGGFTSSTVIFHNPQSALHGMLYRMQEIERQNKKVSDFLTAGTGDACRSRNMTVDTLKHRQNPYVTGGIDCELSSDVKSLKISSSKADNSDKVKSFFGIGNIIPLVPPEDTCETAYATQLLAGNALGPWHKKLPQCSQSASISNNYTYEKHVEGGGVRAKEDLFKQCQVAVLPSYELELSFQNYKQLLLQARRNREIVFLSRKTTLYEITDRLCEQLTEELLGTVSNEIEDIFSDVATKLIDTI